MDFDFAVIGGGIAGTSVGAALSDLGSVCLLEREAGLAYHASGRSAALFESQYGLPETVALSEASADAHHAGGYCSDRGLLFVGGQGQDTLLATDMDGFGLTPLTPSEAQALVPILDTEAIIGAGYHADAWDLDTDLMVQDAARVIRAAGEVRAHSAVIGVNRITAGWRITTTSGDVTARTLVNAAGAWADQIAVLAGVAPLGLTPLRRSMARIPAPGGHDVSRWPMMIGAGETWYAKPDAGAYLVSPAEEDPSDPMDAYADDMVLAEGVARYEAVVSEPVTRMLSNWAGLRTFTPDRRLALGRAGDAPDFIWVAGQGGYGFQTAPAAATLVADQVAGRTPSLPAHIVDALDPRRFS